MSSSSLLQQCPACLIRLIWMVCQMGGKWLFSSSFVGYCFQDLLKTVPRIFVLISSSLFSMHFVSIHVVHPYSSIVTVTAWKKSCFILSDRSHFYLINNLSIAFDAFARYMLTSLSVNEILLPSYGNLFTSFKSLPHHIYQPMRAFKKFYASTRKSSHLLFKKHVLYFIRYFPGLGWAVWHSCRKGYRN